MSSRKQRGKGSVDLIGAGPGDPGLITVQGLKLLRRADTVVYDALVNPDLLVEAPRNACRVFMGKRKGVRCVTQARINRFLVAEARRGRRVVRLKGGDPLLFGRGAEEVAALRRAGIRYRIVPGVSSAWAVPAYADISLTDRLLSSSVALVTGHERSGKESGTGRVRWKELSRGADTLVVFMGATRLAQITRRLIRSGRRPSTPCALICWGTTAKQRVIYSTLNRVVARAEQLGFGTPALFVVGRVAGARRLGRWWRAHRLKGKSILITRPRNQSSELAELLRKQGARIATAATIRIQPASSFRALDQAIARIGHFDWLIFTSVNGVESFFRRWKKFRKNKQVPHNLRIAVIGPATLAAVRRQGLKVSVVPRRYQAEGLLDAFRERGIRLKGKRLLLPRAARVRPALVQGLRKKGARVSQAEAYRTIAEPQARNVLRRLASKGRIDVITFTSSSTVEHFVSLLGAEAAHRLTSRALVASIGPITSGTLSRFGFAVDIEARKSTVPDLVRAIETYYN